MLPKPSQLIEVKGLKLAPSTDNSQKRKSFDVCRFVSTLRNGIPLPVTLLKILSVKLLPVVSFCPDAEANLTIISIILFRTRKSSALVRRVSGNGLPSCNEGVKAEVRPGSTGFVI
uniref:Uncharacterized protein n=1 Tax=Glossina pallidipes TaxID=7398 RepID=A0A1A9ZJ65_GLOPL